jgi:hypothetical protein
MRPEAESSICVYGPRAAAKRHLQLPSSVVIYAHLVRYAVPRKQLETMGVRSRKSHGRGASKLYLVGEYVVAVRLANASHSYNPPHQ